MLPTPCSSLQLMLIPILNLRIIVLFEKCKNTNSKITLIRSNRRYVRSGSQAIHIQRKLLECLKCLTSVLETSNPLLARSLFSVQWSVFSIIYRRINAIDLPVIKRFLQNQLQHLLDFSSQLFLVGFGLVLGGNVRFHSNAMQVFFLYNFRTFVNTIYILCLYLSFDFPPF